MPEETPPPSAPNTAASSNSPGARTDFRIGEEFGTAEKNLPPTRIILMGVAAILVAVAILAFWQRPKTPAVGSIDQVVSVEIPDQGAVMAAINVSFQNGGEKPFWIHTIQAELQTATNNYTDDAASPVDFERYYQAFPALKQYAIEPLQREAKI